MLGLHKPSTVNTPLSFLTASHHSLAPTGFEDSLSSEMELGQLADAWLLCRAGENRLKNDIYFLTFSGRP